MIYNQNEQYLALFERDDKFCYSKLWSVTSILKGNN